MTGRLTAFLIIGFWTVMMTLLVRMQLQPKGSRLLEVPPRHVIRLLFDHQQTSSLNVMAEGMRYGTLSVHPSVEKDQRVLTFGGSVLLRFPLLPHDRMMCDGKAVLDPELDLQTASLSVTLREAESSVHLEIDVLRQEAVCRIDAPGLPSRDFVIPLTREGLTKLVEDAGLDREILRVLNGNAPPARWNGRRSRLGYRGDEVETYELALERGETSLLSIHVSQLGQILRVETALGITLAPNEF